MKKNDYLSKILMLTLLLVSLMVYTQPVDKTIIYVGQYESNEIREADSIMMDSVANWITNVVFMDAGVFNPAPADSLYGDGADAIGAEGVIISESIGSTSVPNFGLRDNYPVPVIIMEGVLTNDPASTEKWPLLLEDGGVWGYASPEAVDVQWKIVDDEHYITDEYNIGDILSYAETPDRGVPYLHGISPSHVILATAAREEGGVDNPTFVQEEAIAIGYIEDPEILFINVAYTYLAVGTTDFYNIMHRSVEFMFDAIPEEPIDAVEELFTDAIKLAVYPNPAELDATISFYIEAGEIVSVNIYDLTGGLVKNIYKGSSVAGKNVVHADLTNYTSGIYFVELQIGNKIAHTKLVVK